MAGVFLPSFGGNPDEEGERVYRASSEAINLYTEMLGYNLEDAAEADLAVLKYQSQRGRLDDAIQTARQAQIRAKAYAETIRLRLEVARRDADQAKWTTEVLPQMTHALGHIRERQRKEAELRTGLEQRRDQAGGDDLGKLTRLLDELEKSEITNLDSTVCLSRPTTSFGKNTPASVCAAGQWVHV